MSNVVKITPRLPVRWVATCYYRTTDGLLDVDHGFQELFELHDIIERGPDWHTLDRIEVRMRRNDTPDLTIEQARDL